MELYEAVDLLPLLEEGNNLRLEDLRRVPVRYHKTNSAPKQPLFATSTLGINFTRCTYRTVLSFVWGLVVLCLAALVAWESTIDFVCLPVLVQNFTSVDLKLAEYVLHIASLIVLKELNETDYSACIKFFSPNGSSTPWLTGCNDSLLSLCWPESCSQLHTE